MEQNTNGNNESTQYIRSNNTSNTIDNLQRHTKEEDPLSPGYTNPPIGNDEQESASPDHAHSGKEE